MTDNFQNGLFADKIAQLKSFIHSRLLGILERKQREQNLRRIDRFGNNSVELLGCVKRLWTIRLSAAAWGRNHGLWTFLQNRNAREAMDGSTRLRRLSHSATFLDF